MVRIYRMENEKGKGPYASKTKFRHKAGPPDYERHPSPSQDPKLHGKANPATAKFAFTSPDHAKAWFNNEEQDELHKEGHAINAYDVPEWSLRRGHKQAIVLDDEVLGKENKLPTPKITVEK